MSRSLYGSGSVQPFDERDRLKERVKYREMRTNENSIDDWNDDKFVVAALGGAEIKS